MFIQLWWLVTDPSSVGNIYFIFTDNLRQPRCGNPSSRHSVVHNFLPPVLMVWNLMWHCWRKVFVVGVWKRCSVESILTHQTWGRNSSLGDVLRCLKGFLQHGNYVIGASMMCITAGTFSGCARGVSSYMCALLGLYAITCLMKPVIHYWRHVSACFTNVASCYRTVMLAWGCSTWKHPEGTRSMERRDGRVAGRMEQCISNGSARPRKASRVKISSVPCRPAWPSKNKYFLKRFLKQPARKSRMRRKP